MACALIKRKALHHFNFSRVIAALVQLLFIAIPDSRLARIAINHFHQRDRLFDINARTGQPERLGKTLTVCGKKQTDTPAIVAGDIGAVAKLATAKTGDTLCDPARVVTLPAPSYPVACYRMAVRVAKKGDEGKVSGALARLIEEDPAISFTVDPETKQQIISGLGTQHLEVAVAKLKNKFGVEITLEVPRVPYRESIRKSCKAQGRHKKQTGGHGQFGDVWIQFEPIPGEDVGQMLTLATAIEGHPDNVAPAMLGGFVTSVYDEGQVYSVKKNIDEQLAFAAFVPDFRLLTSKARAALPDMVSHKDAVYNLSRAALATAAFCDGDYSLLGVATKDSLHQKYRLPLIDGGDEMFELAQDLGALAVYISGAGPTIMAVVPRDDQEFFARAQEALPQSEKLKHFTVYRLLPDNTGATVE